VEEPITLHIREKEVAYNKLEEEIYLFKRKFDEINYKLTTSLKFEKRTRILDDMLR